MNLFSPEKKQEVQKSLKELMGEYEYNKMFNILCQKLNEKKQKLLPMFKDKSEDLFRQEIIKEFLSQSENDELRGIKLGFCEVVLDTILIK